MDVEAPPPTGPTAGALLIAVMLGLLPVWPALNAIPTNATATRGARTRSSNTWPPLRRPPERRLLVPALGAARAVGGAARAVEGAARAAGRRRAGLGSSMAPGMPGSVPSEGGL